MVQALVIVFRESFEAFLIVAITIAYLKKTGRGSLRSAVSWGIGVSLAASFLLGFWLQRVNQPLWEGIFALAAAALVITFVVHLWIAGRHMQTNIESRIERQASKQSAPFAWLGVFAFTLLMITREGMETALLLIQVRNGRFWLGCAAGLFCAASLAWMWARYGHRIPLKRFFQVTGLFLLLFSVQIVFYAIHEFSEAEILPDSERIHLLTEPYSADGRYSLWMMAAIVGICAVWLAATMLMDGRTPARATVTPPSPPP